MPSMFINTAPWNISSFLFINEYYNNEWIYYIVAFTDLLDFGILYPLFDYYE